MVRKLSPIGTDASDLADGASSHPNVVDPAAVPVKPAVSVLMIRDSPSGTAGIEVFVQHRVATMDFAANVVVFPGGRVDPVDKTTALEIDVPDSLTHTSGWATSSIAEVDDGWRVLLATAVREVEEETGAVLDPRDLKPWANWVTPVGRPKRFDTYFYVTRPNEQVAPTHRTTEAHKSEWLPVRTILDAEVAGELKLMRPTLTLLGELSEFSTAEAVVTGERSIVPVRPSQPADDTGR